MRRIEALYWHAPTWPATVNEFQSAAGGLDIGRMGTPPIPLTDIREELHMSLKGSKTEQNLKDAFAGESQANRRYLYFANKADVEGQPNRGRVQCAMKAKF